MTKKLTLLFIYVFLFCAYLQAQDRYSGKITDSKGDPLPGVSVKITGTNIGTLTNETGSFSITGQPNQQLEFSYIGFIKKSITLTTELSLKVVLQSQSNDLNEVVVVGYGTQKKVNLTGAVSSVQMDKVLADRPVTSTSQALQGASPGLQVASGSGQPGSPSSINIRGFTSINGGSPLVLVDNVPMSMDLVNPKDIANVSVLKDASASSIYGARAAFGVILITTKKGARNQPIRFDYSGNAAFTRPSSLPQKPTPLQFVSALKDFGTTAYWGGQDINTWLDLLNQYKQNPAQYPTGIATANGQQYPLAQTDIYGKLFSGGFEQIHNLSFSGGSEKTNFRTSVGYTNQNGPITTNSDSYIRYNINSFLNTSLTDKLTASVNVFYNKENIKTPQNYPLIFYNAINFSPMAPTGFGPAPGTSAILPYYTPDNILANEFPKVKANDDLRLFGKLEYSPIKNLKITGEYTFNRTSVDSTSVFATVKYLNPANFTVSPANAVSSYAKGSGVTNYNALNLYANYTAVINDAHNLSFVLGTNQESSKQNGYTANRLGLITPLTPSLSTSTGVVSANDNFNEFAVSGYFGRLNYSYKNRYLLEGTGRFDGSSRFPAGHRFGFFPSFSAGWNITEESFMEPVKKTFSLIKLRGSYGEIGNQVIKDDDRQIYYPSIPGLNPVNAPWINPATNIPFVSLKAPLLVSANFTWERVQTIDLGLDIGLFKDRLSGSFDVFRRKTLDMLSPALPLPATLGTSAPLQNVADLKTDGWEMEVNWKDNIKKFNYSFGFNLSNNQATITRFNNPGGLLNTYYVGQKINEIWGYQTQGFFTTADFVPGSLDASLQNGKLLPGVAPFQGVLQNPGDIRYADLNGDGKIFSGNNTVSNPGDRRIIGNSTRKFQYGFNGNASYAGFDLSFFVQGVGKRDLWISNAVFFPYISQFSGIFAHQLNYWTPTNTNAYYARLYANGDGNAATSRNIQTKYLSNAAYLRLKNISMGYTLPKKWVSKASLNAVRLFFSGENLLTFDHLPDGLDAEAINLGTGGIYPFLKKYSFGLNVTF